MKAIFGVLLIILGFIVLIGGEITWVIILVMDFLEKYNNGTAGMGSILWLIIGIMFRTLIVGIVGIVMIIGGRALIE